MHELHSDPGLQPSDVDSSDTEANSDNTCADPEQPAVQMRSDGTLHLDNRPDGKPISNEYIDILDDSIDL
jgi:hypothetical protein